ncbi:general secretion pathway protein GspK [Acidovorax sp. MR-S7]|uniref:general secretion pathway protein GspK n=1 Tax=Acidovorax sp. MR-S7 TaxID=1268622 RepID=UPI000380914B|nr:type II secretion system protein GspK [Acidovorax sp. MR-S7]
MAAADLCVVEGAMSLGLKNKRGTALVLVLWLVAALSLLVLVSASSIRQQTQRVSVDLERLRMELALDTALQLGVQKLMADRSAAGLYRRQRLQLDENTIQIEIIPASGLVDVNVASDALLQALLERAGGMTSGEAVIMTARIRDYIDPDSEPGGVGGAEAPQYRAAGKPTGPKNGGLDDLSELRMVLGMTPELYEIISPYLAINGQSRIQIDAAPPSLIDVLSGQQGLGERIHSSPPESRESELMAGPAAEFFSVGQSGAGAVRMRVSIQADGGRWWQREAWIDLSARPDSLTPWTTLSLEPTRRMNSPENRNSTHGR